MSSPGQKFTAEERQVLILARDALIFGIAKRPGRAAKVIQRISDDHGPDGVGLTLMAWADALITQQNPTGDKPIRMEFMNADDGARTDNADEVPPEFAWAGRMILARAADDQDTWMALINAVPGDDWNGHVAVLFEMITLTLRDRRWQP